MAEFIRLKLMPLEKQLKVAQSEWQRAVSHLQCGVPPHIIFLSCLQDAPKPKRQTLDTPPNKPSITKSGVAILKDCCGATQCAVM